MTDGDAFMINQTKIAFVHSENGYNDIAIGSGIDDYVLANQHLQLITWPDPSFESLSFLKRQGCAGAIVNVRLAETAKKLAKLNIPIIAYSCLQNVGPFPYITTDSKKVTETAFDYFSKKQFVNFAFFGLTEARWAHRRLEFFYEIVTDAGHQLHVFETEPGAISDDLTSFIQLWTGYAMTKSRVELVDWLNKLPKPVAILASCDILGCYLSYFVEEAGFSIPNEVAILGIDNNESICKICNSPLSSIALNLSKAGYDAVELLDKMISGKEKARGQRIRIEPLHVIERASTDIFAIDDTYVIEAMKFIHEHSGEPLQVGEIAEHCCVSKRLLQSKFKDFLKQSIHDVIIGVHFQKARLMLIETNNSIEQISKESGFGTSSKMRRAFLSITGIGPQKYRHVHRSHK